MSEPCRWTCPADGGAPRTRYRHLSPLTIDDQFFACSNGVCDINDGFGVIVSNFSVTSFHRDRRNGSIHVVGPGSGTADAAVQAVSRKLGGVALPGYAMTSSADDSVVYPVLSDDDVATLRRYGTVRQTAAGQVLFSPADDSYDLVVVLSGCVEVADESHGRSMLWARDGPGQFAGELNLLTGQRPFVTVRVTAAGQVVTVAPSQLRELLAREADLAAPEGPVGQLLSAH